MQKNVCCDKCHIKSCLALALFVLSCWSFGDLFEIETKLQGSLRKGGSIENITLLQIQENLTLVTPMQRLGKIDESIKSIRRENTA